MGRPASSRRRAALAPGCKAWAGHLPAWAPTPGALVDVSAAGHRRRHGPAPTRARTGGPRARTEDRRLPPASGRNRGPTPAAVRPGAGAVWPQHGRAWPQASPDSGLGGGTRPLVATGEPDPWRPRANEADHGSSAAGLAPARTPRRRSQRELCWPPGAVRARLAGLSEPRRTTSVLLRRGSTAATLPVVAGGGSTALESPSAAHGRPAAARPRGGLGAVLGA